ncbi:uncharacterized protein LOC143563680 [Bidens hawaiensis]|uniref:uncharacterized protein LOC143563680 n=1 Tax=Bidens hawaiensis TaxID=980011 RepID=UPI004049ED2A
MPVLRSRKPGSSSSSSPNSGVEIEPATPAKEVESKPVQSSDNLGLVVCTDSMSGSNQGLRRSARLSLNRSLCNAGESVGCSGKRKAVKPETERSVRVRVLLDSDNGSGSGSKQCGEESGAESVKCLRVRSGKKVSKREVNESENGTEEDVGVQSVENVEEACGEWVKCLRVPSGKKVSKREVNESEKGMEVDAGVQSVENIEEACGESVKCLRVRSGKKVSKWESESENGTEEDVDGGSEGGVTSVKKVEETGAETVRCLRVRAGKKVLKREVNESETGTKEDVDGVSEGGITSVKKVEELGAETVKCLRVRSGKKVLKREVKESEKGMGEDVGIGVSVVEKESDSVRVSLDLDNEIGTKQCGEEDVQSVKKVEELCAESVNCLRTRSGKKVLKLEVNEGEKGTEEDVGIGVSVVDDSCVKVVDEMEKESGSVRVPMELDNDTGTKQCGEEDVQSVKKVEESCSESVKGLRLGSRKKLSRTEIKEDVNGVSEGGAIIKDVDVNGTIERDRRRFSVQAKGKGKAIEVSSSSESDFSVTDYLITGEPEEDGLMDTAMTDTLIPEEVTINRVAPIDKMDPKERFKSVAKENASRFAHFSIQEEDVDEDELEPQLEANGDMEDWPGPFSTAMKIIKDRESNMSTEQKKQSKATPLIWVPKKNDGAWFKKTPPSLEELCVNIMAENVDAITSLESVPDALRHKLTQALCDSRKMNHHFFNLLASKSPTEIRVKDCSWLNEDQFTKTFEAIDASNLTVLQLDQCGRCLPDYVLYATLNNLPNKLSALTNISIKGACRLSDAGLNALVTSASALRSINLGCCSLLTSDAIVILADKLGSVLKELYIDECFGIDAKSILPALLSLQHLEVLSMSRSESVNNSFITQFVAVQGHKMKELVLADCTRLTDRAIKAIAESCPGLCAIDLTNVCKLTDASLGHLANGCETIRTMKFSRNTFSDEAVAAYLEARGGTLTELSLNHVDKVAHHTALSLAKHAIKLQSLDLSWCREMTDEALGLIVDNCLSLKMVKLFGCTQITNVFTYGHSNENVKIVGLQESQILKNIVVPDLLPLRYSSV